MSAILQKNAILEEFFGMMNRSPVLDTPDHKFKGKRSPNSAPIRVK
jgi:hypothetical protein